MSRITFATLQYDQDRTDFILEVNKELFKIDKERHQQFGVIDCQSSAGGTKFFVFNMATGAFNYLTTSQIVTCVIKAYDKLAVLDHVYFMCYEEEREVSFYYARDGMLIRGV